MNLVLLGIGVVVYFAACFYVGVLIGRMFDQ